jgi:hypothetical protein
MFRFDNTEVLDYWHDCGYLEPRKYNGVFYFFNDIFRFYYIEVLDNWHDCGCLESRKYIFLFKFFINFLKRKYYL